MNTAQAQAQAPTTDGRDEHTMTKTRPEIRPLVFRPTTSRFYQFRVKGGEWARIWITDDGSISILSDHGDYGHWFSPGMEFRAFLIGATRDGSTEYLEGKFAMGYPKEYQSERTAQILRELLLEARRRDEISREDAREAWDQIENSVECGDEHDYREFIEQTEFEFDDCASYGPPSQLREFMKRLWPAFIVMLEGELEAEAAEALSASPPSPPTSAPA